MADKLTESLEEWTESQVSTWLKSFGVKSQYIEKLFNEEVNGRSLLTLDEDFLNKKFGLRLGPARLIIKKRDELLNSQDKSQKPTNTKQTKSIQCVDGSEIPSAEVPTGDKGILEAQPVPQQKCILTKEDCKPRPFDQDEIDHIYVKHRVLQPESGAFDLITPCHEFKSFAVAAELDCARLQAKFAHEVLKFATGCMNIRTNGTIHFGVMDSKDGGGYVHGEIIGIPIKDKDFYVDALDYIERCYPSNKEDVRHCVRPPRFVEVMDEECTEKKYVVEVDIVPSISIVQSKVYAVSLPNFKESANKVQMEKKTVLRRVGAKVEPVSDNDLSDFYQRVKDRDVQRDEAEKNHFHCGPESWKDLGRKLTVLTTSGKKLIEKDKWFIFITNKFKPDDLVNIDWLLNMKIFSVFDFDPDSKESGLCNKYLQHHAANMHSLQSYRMSNDTTIEKFIENLHLFEQTSWVFCNGRSGFKGSETPCDEMTWIKTKLTLFKECVSLICKQILPKGTFQVIFLLTSPVEKPLLHTFNEFYAHMEGHEDIICICESEKNFQKWQSFAEGSCGTETVTNFSVVGMKMSHINATMLRIQPMKACAKKYLPVFVKGSCLLETNKEEHMASLEILIINHCDDTSKDFITEEKSNIEHQFYRGGRVTWMNFWLAERKHVGEVIERDAYHDASKLLMDVLKCNADQTPVASINIYHHPGSGGSTVARQVLWKNRNDLRCAVVKSTFSASDVAEHAVDLREYEEKDPQRCLPVLLLIEDTDKEYLDDLKSELEVAVRSKRIQNGTLCFILLSCRRSHNPERRCKESVSQNVSVTHKLSAEEKRKFAEKRQVLEEEYKPEFILTFVLMSEEFANDYVKHFVEHLLQDIDLQSPVTRLIEFVALLNTYVPNSYISQSHCEAFLSLKIYMERFRRQEFEQSLSDQAKLVFLHLRHDKTHIQSIKIIHPLVAKEILQQLLGSQETFANQSDLAMTLLCEDVLFKHRFGKAEYQSALKALLIRRDRISKGDKYDSLFSPLIEHVRTNEKSPEKAIKLLKDAFERFHDDAFFAQQLARLLYTYEMFEDAKYWAETAAKKMPHNSYILDTKGQVYRKWFQAKYKAIENSSTAITAENTADAVETALKAMQCFKECQRAADADMDNVNNSGYFSEVEVGISLLKLIFSVHVFASGAEGRSKCRDYLTTDYIPEDVLSAWELLHGRLKGLQKTLLNALEWISGDLSFFQTDTGEEEEIIPKSPEEKISHLLKIIPKSPEEKISHPLKIIPKSPEEKISHPLKWLTKRSSEYGKYFSEASTTLPQERSNLFELQKSMLIHYLGGGNVTSILSKLTDQKDAVRILENILSLYPSNPAQAKLGQRDIVNYMMTHVTLKCLSPEASQVVPLKDLQTLCQQFPVDKKKCLPSALFLLTLLFWPEDDDTNHERESKYEIVQSAVEHMEKGYLTKKKDIPQRKRRIYTHFVLGSGNGLDKFVHKRKFQSIAGVFSMSEKRMKWFRGEAWRNKEIALVLKRVSGWTEDGVVYLDRPQKKKFSILPLHVPSVPHSNENVTFYLGFTFRGPVAYDIIVNK